MDGGPRLERQCRLGCRRKQSNFRLSGQTRDARSVQAAYHRAMGFPEGLRPRSRRWTLLLSQELRSAAPVGIVRAGSYSIRTRFRPMDRYRFPTGKLRLTANSLSMA